MNAPPFDGISRRLGTAFLACVLAAGCAPDVARAPLTFPFASAFSTAPQASPRVLDNAEWWRRLQDPLFDRLAEAALTGNLTLAAAAARVDAAAAALDAVAPAVTLSARAEAGRAGGRGVPDRSETRLPASLSWILDPWGARQAERAAAGARLQAADAERDAAQLLVLYRLSEAYLDLRLRQRLLSLRRQEAAARRQTLAMTRTLAESEAVTRVDVARASARVAEIESQLPDIEARIRARQAEIAVLTGSAPGTMPAAIAGALATPHPIPRPALSPEIGIPADLLRNRPDIRVAEQLYYAALADADAARAALYPRLSLTGTISLVGRGGAPGGMEYFLGPVLTLPTLPDGPGRAAVAAREAGVRQAHANWQGAVIEAIREVETALGDYQSVARAIGPAGRAVRLYAEARGLTRELFEAGEVTLGDLIDAETAEAQASVALAEAQFRQALSFVALNVRLGAGHAARPIAQSAQPRSHQVPAGRPVAP
ncbi:MAG: efflux transporter outer membrane subunit [Gemmobacter sp.]